MSGENLVHTSDATFEQDVLNSDLPVLVDLWAEWCCSCKMIGPIPDDISITYARRRKIVKLNVDENASTPAKFNIRGIPTLLLFKNGALTAQKVGAASKSALSAFL